MELEEYREIGLNLRHYSNMTYVNLTLTLAVQAALLSAVLRNPPPSTTARVILGVSGMLMTALFYISERRLRLYWRTYFERAKELEPVLGFTQYINAPRRTVTSSSVAIRVVFIISFGFWAVSTIFARFIF